MRRQFSTIIHFWVYVLADLIISVCEYCTKASRDVFLQTKYSTGSKVIKRNKNTIWHLIEIGPSTLKPVSVGEILHNKAHLSWLETLLWNVLMMWDFTRISFKDPGAEACLCFHSSNGDYPRSITDTDMPQQLPITCLD